LIGFIKKLKVFNIANSFVKTADLCTIIVDGNGIIVESSQNMANLLNYQNADELKSANLDINIFNDMLLNSAHRSHLEAGIDMILTVPAC
jgi:hypothetical protein